MLNLFLVAKILFTCARQGGPSIEASGCKSYQITRWQGRSHHRAGTVHIVVGCGAPVLSGMHHPRLPAPLWLPGSRGCLPIGRGSVHVPSRDPLDVWGKIHYLAQARGIRFGHWEGSMGGLGPC